MSANVDEEILIDQSLEELLPIIATEYDAISRKSIQSSFLAIDTSSIPSPCDDEEPEVVEKLVVEEAKEEQVTIVEGGSDNVTVNSPSEDKTASEPVEKPSSPSANDTPVDASKKEVEIIKLASQVSAPEKIDHERITRMVYDTVETDFEHFEHLSENAKDTNNPSKGDYIFSDILNTLTKVFFVKQSIEECKPLFTIKKFQDIVKSKAVPNYVSSLLEGSYGDSHPVVRFLTLVDQAFVVSLLGHFSESLFFSKSPMRFKDVRGSWRIDLRLYENTLSMVHRRFEQMMKPIGNIQLKNLFQFSWQVEIVYDSYQLDHISSIHVTLLEINWDSYDESAELTEKQKNDLEKNFLRMFSKTQASQEQTCKLPMRISLTEMDPKHLRLLVKELRQQSKKLVKPTENNESSRGWFSGIFSSAGSMDDAVDFVSSRKKD